MERVGLSVMGCDRAGMIREVVMPITRKIWFDEILRSMLESWWVVDNCGMPLSVDVQERTESCSESAMEWKGWCGSEVPLAFVCGSVCPHTHSLRFKAKERSWGSHEEANSELLFSTKV